MTQIKEELLLNVAYAENFEGFSELPYTCPAGFLTIGFGRNLEVYPYTREEAITWTYGILKSVRKELIIHLPWLVEAHPDVRVMLTDMGYNIGVEGTLKFVKMLAALKEQEYILAAEELKDSLYFNQTGTRAKRHYATLLRLGKEKSNEDTLPV